MAYHPASKSIHVDDTLCCFDMPFPLSVMPMSGRLDFHMALPKALEPMPGAAQRFRNWTAQLAEDWEGAKHVATAHNDIFEIRDVPLPGLISAALKRVEPVLMAHERRYG